MSVLYVLLVPVAVNDPLTDVAASVDLPVTDKVLEMLHALAAVKPPVSVDLPVTDRVLLIEHALEAVKPPASVAFPTNVDSPFK